MKCVSFGLFLLVSSRMTAWAFVPSSSSSSSSVPQQKQQHVKHSPYHSATQPLPITTTTTTSLHAASPLTALASSPAGSLAILATIVLIHEGGHYLAARTFGMKVEEFSVGIGPKIAGIQAFGNEFNLRALPLGGYVRFPENCNVTQVQQQEAAAAKQVRETIVEPMEPGKKVLDALTLGAITEQEMEKENERRLQQANEWKQQPWWRKLGRKPEPSDPLVLPDQVEIEYYDDPALLQNRDWKQRSVVLSGGIIFNFLLSFSIYFGLVASGPGLPSPVFASGAVVSAQPRPDAAANGILRQGDVIVAVNGQALTLSQSPSVAESQRGINQFISTIRSTPDGQALDLQVVRSGSSEPTRVELKPQRAINNNNNNNQAAATPSIGVLLSPNFVKSERLQADNPVQAAGIAAQYTTTLIRDTAAGLTGVLSDTLTGKAQGAQVSGPIGLIKTGSDIVATKDLTAVYLFMAALSINLGVVNAFPLPALDGGQLLFVFWEALSGRKVNQRVQESITGATLLLLLFISLSAAVGDIEKIFLTTMTN